MTAKQTMARATLSLLITGAAQVASAQVSVVYSTYVPQGAIANRQYEAYLAELEQRSGGHVKVKEKFFAQALLKATESLRGVGQRLADVGFYCTGNHPAQLPLSSMAEIPYTTDRGDAVSSAMAELYETYPALRREFNANNVEALAWDVSSPTVIGVKKVVSSAKELAGLKIRGYGEVGNIVRKGGGMVPVNMGIGEVLTSLQTGVLDGYSGVPMWLPHASKWLPETKTIVSPGIGTYYTCGLVMNLDVYRGLPDNVKAIIAEMRRAHPAKAAKMVMEADNAAVADAQKLGIKFYEFTAEEALAWKKGANFENVVDEWAKTHSANTREDPKKFLAAFLAAVKKYEPSALYRQNLPK